MAPLLTPIAAPRAEPPQPGSAALLPTLGRSVTIVGSDREVPFTFNPEQCGVSGVGPGDPCVQTAEKVIAENPAMVETWDFYTWAGDKCSAFGFQERDWQQRALDQLGATLSYQVAHEFWTGDQAQVMGAPNLYLANEVFSDVLTPSPSAAGAALGLLEQYARLCAKGARAFIHATASAATAWAEAALLRVEGQSLLTHLGSVVIADAGYDGSGPNGQPAIDGSQWAYVTGRPIVRLGPERTVPDNIAQAIDRTDNSVEWRAERKAAVSYDGCCNGAVEINLPWPDVAGAGS